MESVETKQKDRFAEAIAYYTKFVDTYPDSRFLKEGEDLYETAKKFVETHP
jgi:outer membrane protein assembly factor BamD